PRRPEEGHDQRGRVQGLAAGGRGRALRAPGGPRGRRGRGPRRVPRRDGQGLRVAEAGRAGDRGGADRVLPGPDGGVQVPADDRVPRRAAEDAHGQDPAARTPEQVSVTTLGTGPPAAAGDRRRPRRGPPGTGATARWWAAHRRAVARCWAPRRRAG